jgi:GH15 family glucan-1,4-alpha-glucosidase
LDGLFVLKCGKDIRLPADMVVGQDRKVSFTFTMSFDVVSNSATPTQNNQAQCQFVQMAYFPSMYKFSPSAGLLKAERFVLSDKEFKDLVEATNRKVSNNTWSNNVYYTSQRPLMVGSGFGNLFSWARSKIPIIKSLATAVGAVADMFDNDTARTVSKGAKAIHSALGGKKKRSAKRAGRPKKIYA